MNNNTDDAAKQLFDTIEEMSKRGIALLAQEKPDVFGIFKLSLEYGSLMVTLMALDELTNALVNQRVYGDLVDSLGQIHASLLGRCIEIMKTAPAENAEADEMKRRMQNWGWN